MHVLILPSFYSEPGHPRRAIFVAEQVQALRRGGIEAGIAYAECRRLHEFRPALLRQSHFQTRFDIEGGVPTVRMHGWNPLSQYPPGGRVWVALTRRLVRRYVREMGMPQLLHAHVGLWAGYAASVLGVEFGLPYVLTEHSSAVLTGLIPRSSTPYLRRAYENAAAVIAVGEPLSAAVTAYSGRANVIVIPNLVDTGFFGVHERPMTGGFRLLALGSLIPNKGFDLLLNAFARAFPRDPDVTLEIGGDGPEHAALESRIEALSLRGRVRMLGELDRSEVRSAFWRSDAFVSASHQETFGVVLIEALSTGIPVVATRCGGPEGFITPAVGLLVEPGNEQELAAALRRIRGQPLAYPARRLREFVTERFSDERIVSRLSGLYKDVCRRPAGPSN